ncbi:MAG: EamA family transporter [Rhodocyclaceae bacterium]|nr:EamA family transporter [Rhodocyclaceae bacterium]
MQGARTQLDRFAIGLMVVLCAIWGVQQVTIKVANAGISPLFQGSLRSLGATLLVGLWALGRGVPLGKRDGTLGPGVLVGLLFSVEFGFIYWGLTYTTASRGVIFLYTAPFFVALGAVYLLPHERMHRSQWLGMALAFGGIVALFGENLLRPQEKAWLGDLMLLGGAFFWAATTLTVKASRLSTAAPEKTLLYQLGGSALLLPFLAWGLGEPGVTALTLSVALALAFQVVVVASVSYLAWFWLVRHYPATRLSSFSFLTPVFGVLAAGVLGGEALTPGVWLALGLVAAGIWVANRPG